LKMNSLITKLKKANLECYACRNGLTGLDRWDGTMWECRCEQGFAYLFFCPICGSHFSGSSFLASQIENPPDLWLANMIMHYRHKHRKWDSQWKYIQRNCKEGTYETEKKKVNNQIKRALLKSKEFLTFAVENGVTKESFLRLLDNEEKTVELVNKKFGD
jgi:hypothetical protein